MFPDTVTLLTGDPSPVLLHYHTCAVVSEIPLHLLYACPLPQLKFKPGNSLKTIKSKARGATSGFKLVPENKMIIQRDVCHAGLFFF